MSNSNIGVDEFLLEMLQQFNVKFNQDTDKEIDQLEQLQKKKMDKFKSKLLSYQKR